jgi:hypothetical protein
MVTHLRSLTSGRTFNFFYEVLRKPSLSSSIVHHKDIDGGLSMFFESDYSKFGARGAFVEDVASSMDRLA